MIIVIIIDTLPRTNRHLLGNDNIFAQHTKKYSPPMFTLYSPTLLARSPLKGTERSIVGCDTISGDKKVFSSPPFGGGAHEV
jgi:hypothetical protein